jgi:hypothetical protein
VEFNARLKELRDGGLEAYHARYYAPDAVLENVDSFPMPARYEGAAGYRTWFDESYGPYEDVRWVIDDVRAAGERVLALVRVSGRPQGDPTVLEVRVACLYDMAPGPRIARVRVYLGYERGLAAAAESG